MYSADLPTLSAFLMLGDAETEQGLIWSSMSDGVSPFHVKGQNTVVQQKEVREKYETFRKRPPRNRRPATLSRHFRRHFYP